MKRWAEQVNIRVNRFWRRTWAAPRLRRDDSRPVPERKPGEVWAFLIVHNEALRLPFVLRYHFERGVSRVIALDNQSTDGTQEILRSNSRIHLFSTGQPFRKNKVAWLEWLLRRHGRNQWNLVLDADELFVYPHMDRLDLPGLAAYLDGRRMEALHSLFIEMFPRGPIGEVQYRPGEDLREATPWFDAEGYERKKYHRVFEGESPEFIYMGGTRARLFHEEFGCSKYPFFRYEPDQFLRLGLHTIEGAKIAEEQGAVLHFKYLQDFKEKAVREAKRGVYWNASAEYKAYAARFEKEGDFSLWHPGAKKFAGWQQLEELGLMKSSRALDSAAGAGGARA